MAMAYYSKYSTSEPSSEQLSPLEELIDFLKFYIDADQAKQFEKKAKYFTVHPDEETKHFVDDVLKAIGDRLLIDRRELKETARKLIKNYNEEMKKPKTAYELETCSNHSCDQERTIAAKQLIEGLETIIPEAKRSNYRSLASHVLTEDLDEFLDELQDDLQTFLDDREREINHRLQARMDAFLDELLELSRQLRMVSKINLFVDVLTNEKVPDEAKAEIKRTAEEITMILRSSRMTPALIKDINKLIKRVKKITETFPTHRLKHAARELERTANYICNPSLSREARGSIDSGTSKSSRTGAFQFER